MEPNQLSDFQDLKMQTDRQLRSVSKAYSDQNCPRSLASDKNRTTFYFVIHKILATILIYSRLRRCPKGDTKFWLWISDQTFCPRFRVQRLNSFGLPSRPIYMGVGVEQQKIF